MEGDRLMSYPFIKTAGYEDPKTRVEMPERKLSSEMRTLCVINTYIPKTGWADYTTRYFTEGDPIRYYRHDRVECLKFMLAAHDHYDPGMPCDIIIVDNSSPHTKAVDIMTSCGLPFYSRPNTYLSFGAYRYAFEKFGHLYDYFVFHEMDWVPTKDHWLTDLVNFWVSDQTIGMIGNLIESRGANYPPETDNEKTNNDFVDKIAPHRADRMWNLDSEYLFTSRFVLDQMLEHDGWLMFPCVPETNLSAAFNELAFQQPLMEMGYKIGCYNDGEHTMWYATYNNAFSPKWDKGLENIVPFAPEQTRFFMPEMAKHFDFYNHHTNNSFVGFGEDL